jgi:hypothetical protein
MSFEERVALIRRGPDDCWLWTGATTPYGYGHFRRNKRDEYAHRAAYELLVGPIPPGAQIDHTCENTGCCNPKHMQPLQHAKHVATTWNRTTHCRNRHRRSTHGWHVFPNGTRICQACYVDWYTARNRRKASLAKDEAPVRVAR